MAKKKKDAPRAPKGGKPRYVKPKMTRHGNLETVAQRIAGTVALACCVTERLRASRTSSFEREGLIDLASRAVAAGSSR
jgi:hypothetical protein